MEQPLRNDNLEQQLVDLQDCAVEVFGDREAALRWLDTDLWELDNLSPREMVTRHGASGLGRARDVLLRIEYGVYS